MLHLVSSDKQYLVQLLLNVGLNQNCCVALELNLLPLYPIPRHCNRYSFFIQLIWAEHDGDNGDECHQFQVTFRVFNLDICSFMLICCLIQFCTILSFRLFTTSSLHFPYLLSFHVFIGLLFLSLQLFSPFLSYPNQIPSALTKFSPQEINKCAQLPK